jgi:hypothetical protein
MGQQLSAAVAGLAALATIAYTFHDRRKAEREAELTDDADGDR